MPRPCLICSDSRKTAKAAELIGQGLSDQKIADALSALTPHMPRLSEMAVSRHRRMHLLAPAQAAAAAVAKDSAAREQRARHLAAIDNGDALAVVDALFSASALAKKLDRIEGRLERASEIAYSSSASATW
jgi:hypothetical protein